MTDELVSITIPTHNSESAIEVCLRSIKEQTYLKYEVIVVDNYSTDSTKEIVRKFGAKIIEKETGRSQARNIGAKIATGKFILFLDSDMELTPNIVSECVNRIKQGYDALIIPEKSVGEGFWAECKALEKTCYIGDNILEAARFYKRSVFNSTGGYDRELLFGEDKDLDIRLRKSGFKIGRIRAFIQHHEGRLNLRESTLTKYHYGKTILSYRAKHPEETKQQLRLIRPAFVRNWRKLAKDPSHAIGLLLMKTCEFWALWLGHLSRR
jgi:glycosyltransferase involved in cell wall biosynthesis